MKYAMVCLVLFAVTASAGFSILAASSPGRSTPAHIVQKVAAAPSQQVIEPGGTSPTNKVPRVEIAEREIDFGIVEPLQTHEHRFSIRNVGTAPLALTNQGTSCKCLQIDVLTPVIAPGDTGSVAVRWAPSPTQDVFLQRATIATDDPANRRIDFKVQGQVRLAIAAEPPSLAAGRIKPNERAVASTTIVSQVWNDFTIDDVHSTLPGVEWKLSPASQSELERLRAKSGWRLVVTYPSDMPTGKFQETMHFTARPSNPAPSQNDNVERAQEPVNKEIPLEGTVLRRLAVYGEGIQPWGTIEAGLIEPQRGYEGKFVLKVNDDEPALRVTRIATTPEFVEAVLEPYTGTGKPGLYRLHVRIPPDGAAGSYRGNKEGNITITFDHPRITSLKLGVDFVVPKHLPQRLGRSDIAMTGDR